jgi:hypothetical protein
MFAGITFSTNEFIENFQSHETNKSSKIQINYKLRYKLSKIRPDYDKSFLI